MVHYLDGVLVPPPRCATLAAALPGRLETFSRALGRTGLGMEGESRRGGSVTLFAPSDEAWEDTLSGEGRRFLFSGEGAAWLRALVRYHVVEGAVYMGGGARGEDGRGSREVRNLLGDKVSVEVDGPETRPDPLSAAGREHGSRLVPRGRSDCRGLRRVDPVTDIACLFEGWADTRHHAKADRRRQIRP